MSSATGRRALALEEKPNNLYKQGNNEVKNNIMRIFTERPIAFHNTYDASAGQKYLYKNCAADVTFHSLTPQYYDSRHRLWFFLVVDCLEGELRRFPQDGQIPHLRRLGH
jgi:hypothetical protein